MLDFFRACIPITGLAFTLTLLYLRTIVPIYQSEISPPNHVRFYANNPPTSTQNRFQRGALACMEFTVNVFGYASSVVCARLCRKRVCLTYRQWTDYFCSFIESDLAWRIPLFIQCVIGAILAAGTLLMPESPRYARNSFFTLVNLTENFMS